MTRTWDTTNTSTTNTAFTTARSWSHTVGSSLNRLVGFAGASEDFSTGGAAQTPSSVAYGGNALTLDDIAKTVSLQTACLYTGLDSVCGTAGAHNMVVTYAGQVDSIVCWAFSTDNIKQQAKEATGSRVETSSVSSGTSTITTLTAKSLIIAVAGEDEGTASGVTHSWNVGTKLGDLSIGGVGGSVVRYEKATAGSQGMIDTLSEGVTRLAIVSAAYETINEDETIGSSSGVATVTGIGSVILKSTGASTGEAAVNGISSTVVNVVGNSSGSAAVNGQGDDVGTPPDPPSSSGVNFLRGRRR